MAAAKTAAWKAMMRRLNHIDLRASSGWSANTADSHSWLRTSSDSPQKKLERGDMGRQAVQKLALWLGSERRGPVCAWDARDTAARALDRELHRGDQAALAEDSPRLAGQRDREHLQQNPRIEARLEREDILAVGVHELRVAVVVGVRGGVAVGLPPPEHGEDPARRHRSQSG